MGEIKKNKKINKKLILGVAILLLLVGGIIMFVPKTSSDNNSKASTQINSKVENNNLDNQREPPVEGEIPANDSNRPVMGERPTGGRPDMENGDGMMLPLEALEACIGLSEGDSCSFSTPRDEEITSTCSSLEGELICAIN